MMMKELIHLYHRKQEQLYGCIYHAAYAVTGDETFLKHVEDVSWVRWRVRMKEAGYVFEPIYCNGKEPATPSFWRYWLDWQADDYGALMILSIHHGKSPTSHTIGAVLSKIEQCVIISDSLRDGFVTVGQDEWPEHQYARVRRAEALLDGDLERWPPEEPFGESYWIAAKKVEELAHVT